MSPTDSPQEIAAAAFAAEGLEPTVWSNGPGIEYAAHNHTHHKVLYCVHGSIVFRTSESEIRLNAGDRLDLPAATSHTAVVGPDGVTCWEAYRPPA